MNKNLSKGRGGVEGSDPRQFCAVGILTTTGMLGCKLKWFIPAPYNTDMLRAKDNWAARGTDGALQYIALLS